jgi:glucose/arabinose dehydrogenase
MRRLACALVLGGLLGCSSDAAPSQPATTETTSASSGSSSSGTPGSFSGLSFQELDAEGDWGMVTDARFIPGTDELLVLEKSGRVGHLRLEGDRFALLGSFTLPDAYSVLDCGLISLALDPDFATNGFFYVGLCVSQQTSEIHRYTLDASDYAAVPGSKALVLSSGDDDAPEPWHNIGSIGFDPDGTLWALFGDKKVPDNGQDPQTPLAAMLRLVPNREPDGEGWTPAEGNAFGDEKQGHPLIYAWGIRSPWKGLRDRAGRYWFGDVGANAVEEINVITAAGQNFGWATAEGPCEEDCDGLVDPVAWWEHDGVSTYAAEDPDAVPTNARVAYVALEVEPVADDPYGGALDDHVLFGEYCQGWVRGARLGSDGLDRDVHLGHLETPSAWMRGRDGYIYAATFGKCETPSIDENDPPKSVFVRAVPVLE